LKGRKTSKGPRNTSRHSIATSTFQCARNPISAETSPWPMWWRKSNLRRTRLGISFWAPITDSVSGTVGADDNGSAVAVQLETARYLASLKNSQDLDLSVKFVSFTLEEPPFFDTPHMGSRVYAGKAKDTGEKIDGMICLEMVGYTCHEPGCQSYPFPLMFFDYPKTGSFIGIVGNLSSRDLTRSLFNAFERNSRLPVIKLTVPLGGWLMPSIRLSDHSAFLGLRFQGCHDNGFSLLQEPPLSPAFRYHGKAGLSFYGRAGSEPGAIFLCPVGVPW